MKGILYVIATPIGNLKDITLRAIEVLQESDLVVAENMERALKLLNHLNIRKPIVTINTYNEERKARSIVDQLLSGTQCALISGAGTPSISDPGTVVVRKSWEAGIEVRAVPGPSAVAGALSISGLQVDKFFFYGFLPQRRGKKKKVLGELLSTPWAVVLYESPRRVRETLELVLEQDAGRLVAVFKEMTKVHEEAIRGPIEEVLEGLPAKDLKGEYTIVIEGRKKPNQ